MYSPHPIYQRAIFYRLASQVQKERASLLSSSFDLLSKAISGNLHRPQISMYKATSSDLVGKLYPASA